MLTNTIVGFALTVVLAVSFTILVAVVIGVVVYMFDLLRWRDEYSRILTLREEEIMQLRREIERLRGANGE